MELTIKQAAAQLGKAESTIRQWLRQGKIEGQKVGKIWMINPASLAALRANPPARKASQTSKAKASKLVRQIATQVVAELKPILLAAMQPVQPQTQAQPLASPEPSRPQASETAQLTEQIATLQSQVQALAKQLVQMQTAQPEPKAKGQSQTAEPEAKPHSQAQGEAKRQPADEAKAEEWARKHIEQWIDEPCKFHKTNGRTWRELGENKGDKIEVNGKLSSPRAYLHAIESWEGGKVWAKVKAKIALELGKNGKHLDAIAG